MLAACGLDRRVNNMDVSQLEEWLRDYSLDLILYAAECAYGKKLPLPYAGKLLENWKKLDVTTVELARRNHEEGRPAPEEKSKTNAPARAAATPNALNFRQRTYQEGELDHVFTDLTAYMEDKKNDAQ